MKPLDVHYSGRALKDFRRLSGEDRTRLQDAFNRYIETGHADIVKLVGMVGVYRLRVGKLRAMFRLAPPDSLIVFAIDNRGEAY